MHESRIEGRLSIMIIRFLALVKHDQCVCVCVEVEVEWKKHGSQKTTCQYIPSCNCSIKVCVYLIDNGRVGISI